MPGDLRQADADDLISNCMLGREMFEESSHRSEEQQRGEKLECDSRAEIIRRCKLAELAEESGRRLLDYDIAEVRCEHAKAHRLAAQDYLRQAMNKYLAETERAK